MQVFESTARTSDATSGELTWGVARFFLIVNVSALSATPSVTPKLQQRDPTSSQWIDIWAASAAVTATGQYVFYFDGDTPPAAWTGITEVEQLRLWDGALRVFMDHADADSITYSVGIETEAS